MSFSSYTLSGLTFLGAGVEYKSADFPVYVSTLFGRFQKENPFIDPTSIEDENYIYEDPAYERWGGGIKIGTEYNNQKFELIVFKIQDILSSLDTSGTNLGLKPEENLLLGISTDNKITDKLSLVLEFTNSIYSSDITTEEIKYETYTYINNLGPLYSPRISTSAKNAYSAELNYQLTKASISLNYKKIAPNFISLGTPVVNNNTEDFTLNTSTNILKEKVSLSASIGLQRDNLDNSALSTNKRIIGSFSANYVHNEALNVNAAYSNYNSSALRSRIIISDSVKYLQTTENLSAAINYTFEIKELKNTLVLNASNQLANTLNQTGTDTLTSGNVMYMLNLSYGLNIPDIDLSFSISGNYTQFVSDDLKNETFGPVAGISKSFFKKKHSDKCIIFISVKY